MPERLQVPAWGRGLGRSLSPGCWPPLGKLPGPPCTWSCHGPQDLET